jgi:hypothetical protein
MFNFCLGQLIIAVLIVLLGAYLYDNKMYKENYSDYRPGFYNKHRDDLAKELIYN